MLTNDQMIKGRYHRWHNARRRIAFIAEHLNAGRIVYIQTALRTTKFTKPEQLAMLKSNQRGCFMQSGKMWVCINGCKISASSK